MWWFIVNILLLGGITSSALNLKYLDPTKLQTISSPEIQKRAALLIVQKYLTDVVIEIDPRLFKEKKDAVTLKIIDEKLHISASTGVAAAWGFNYYLKKYCKSQIEWQTENVPISQPYPYVNETVTANDRFRYYQNVCTASYSFVWWDQMDWKAHIHWMALNGINLALAPVAQEATWIKIYKQIGMTQEEIDQYLAGPAFLSWLRMGNVHGWGGPLPQSWHDLQISIQNEVIPMMLNLGMVPVLPAFNGHVPAAFSRVFPNSKFLYVSQWQNFKEEYCCGLFLDPKDPMFKTIGKMFLNEIKVNGVHVYTADPFNEVLISEFSTPLVKNVSYKIFSSLVEVDKDAVWLLQNWMFVNSPNKWPENRVEAFLNAVPNGRMLILDLQSDQCPQYDRYEMYYGQPFIWCMLHNFGGTLGMHGNMVTINRDVYEARSRVNSTMIGTGLTPEGINQNYVVYDLMLESAWRKSPVQDLNAWVTEYAERRHGCNETAEAYKYLLKSVYSFNGKNRIDGLYVVTRRPSMTIQPWAWYSSYDLFQAYKKLVYTNTSKCGTEGFFYDLTDVARQALQYRAEQLYLNVVKDKNSNSFVLENSINRFIEALDDMAVILRDSDYFSASKWLSKARSIGHRMEDEILLYEMNARNQITLWGPRGEISDYACKQWGELVRDYYRPRWQVFLSAALRARISGDTFDEEGTQRVVTASVEVPYATLTVSENWKTPRLDNPAKYFYRKWAYIADVEDLPILTISPDSYEVPVEALAESETAEPSVVLYTTSND